MSNFVGGVSIRNDAGPKIFDPAEFIDILDNGYVIHDFRRRLRRHLFVARRVRSPHGRFDILVCECGCGKPITSYDAIDLHEGIITRADVAGWPKPQRSLIFHEYNTFLLRHDHHVESPPDREFCYALAAARYGRQKIDVSIPRSEFCGFRP